MTFDITTFLKPSVSNGCSCLSTLVEFPLWLLLYFCFSLEPIYGTTIETDDFTYVAFHKHFWCFSLYCIIWFWTRKYKNKNYHFCFSADDFTHRPGRRQVCRQQKIASLCPGLWAAQVPSSSSSSSSHSQLPTQSSSESEWTLADTVV